VANSSEPLLLSVDEVLTLHDDQLHLFGGSAGIRDRGVLESAVAMRASTFDGVYLHSDLWMRFAALLKTLAVPIDEDEEPPHSP
jgi:death-on-curing protein